MREDFLATVEGSLHAASAKPLYFDRSFLLSQVDGDEQMMKEIVEIFIKTAPALITELLEVVDAGDDVSLRQRAHTLQGSLGSFGLKEAATLAREIETASHQGTDCRELAARLKSMIDRSVCELSATVSLG